MTEEKRELRWLRRSGDEWQWAQQYISKHADAAMRSDIERFARRMVEGYDQVVADIAHLEQSAEGLKFVMRLKNALRSPVIAPPVTAVSRVPSRSPTRRERTFLALSLIHISEPTRPY